MKNYLISLLILASTLCKAQTDTSILTIPSYTPYQELMDSIWMNVDMTHLQTNYLTDYGPWFTDPMWYNGAELTNNNLLNYSKMQSVYNSFAYSEMSEDLILEDWDSVAQIVDGIKEENQIPIVLMSIPFDKVDPQALGNGLITTDGSYLYSDPEAPSPFMVSEFYGASLAADILDTNVLQVVLPSSLIFNQTEKTITHVEVDFSDGSGPQQLLPNQAIEVSYPDTDYGFKPIIYTIYFNDNTWVSTHGGVTLKYKYDMAIGV